MILLLVLPQEWGSSACSGAELCRSHQSIPVLACTLCYVICSIVDQGGGFSCYNIGEFPIYKCFPFISPSTMKPEINITPLVLSSLLRGFCGTIVRASIVHLWDCGFDPHIALMTLVWKGLANTLPKVWFPTTENVDRVGISPLINPSTIAVRRHQSWVIRWLPECP
jgi:hypothetical protein